MANAPHPFEIPEWRALHREASLVGQLLGSGLTALSRASYGSGFGEYYSAFFGLSVGVERLAKLVIIADHSITHGGQLPAQSIVRKSGHRISELILRAEIIAHNRQVSTRHVAPSDTICRAVIACLDAFADAARGRYANFEAIGNAAFNPADEPVNRWWSDVVEPILSRHYRGRAIEKKVRRHAALAGAVFGDVTSVQFLNESGRKMTDLQTASERTGQTRWAQKYGRLYVGTVIRWLSEVFEGVSHKACYEAGVDAMFGHYEFFESYTVDDSFYLSRKVWPLH